MTRVPGAWEISRSKLTMTIDAEGVRRAAEAAARAFPDRAPTPVQRVPDTQESPPPGNTKAVS